MKKKLHKFLHVKSCDSYKFKEKGKSSATYQRFRATLVSPAWQMMSQITNLIWTMFFALIFFWQLHFFGKEKQNCYGLPSIKSLILFDQPVDHNFQFPAIMGISQAMGMLAQGMFTFQKEGEQ